MKKALVSLLFSAVFALGLSGMQAQAAEAVTQTVPLVVEEEPLVQGGRYEFAVKNEDKLTVSSKAITWGDYTYVFSNFDSTGFETQDSWYSAQLYEKNESVYEGYNSGRTGQTYNYAMKIKAFEGEKTIQLAVFDDEGNLCAGTEKTVKAEVYSGGCSNYYINPAELSSYINVYLPIADVQEEAVKVELLDGNNVVGLMESPYTSNTSWAYVSSVLGMDMTSISKYNGQQYAQNSATNVNGTLYIAEKLTEGKTYALRATVDGKEYSLGNLVAETKSRVTYAGYTSSYVSDKPVINVQIENMKPSTLTVELRNEKDETVATSKGGQMIQTYKTTAIYELATDLSKKELAGTKIVVLDADGKVVFDGNNYYDYAGVVDAYYNYANDTVMMLTSGLVDNTEVNATITYNEKEYKAAGKVQGGRVSFSFTCDGAACKLPSGYYYMEVTYKMPDYPDENAESNVYLSVQNGQESTGVYTYNSAYPWRFASGATSYEFTYTISKSLVPETGDFTAKLINRDDKVAVGEAFAMTAAEKTYSDGVVVYELKGTWTGEALPSGSYTLQLYRGDKEVEDCDYVIALDPSVPWGYINCSVAMDGTARATVGIYSIQENQQVDKSKIALNVADLLGRPVGVKVEAAENKYSGEVSYKLSEFGNLSGLTLKATYDGKEICNYSYPAEKKAYSTKVTFSKNETFYTYYGNTTKEYARTGLGISCDVKVQVREVGTLQLLKTFDLKAQSKDSVTYVRFTDEMLSGLKTDGSVQYWFISTKADGEFVGSAEIYPVVEKVAVPDEPEVPAEPEEEESKLVTVPTKEQDPEQVEGFVSRMYTVALGRDFDNDGLQDWKGQLLEGKRDGAGIAQGFIGSPEFKNKTLTDEEYLKLLYNTFFNREPDDGGKADWLGKMAEGTSRENVLVGFVNSDEFANLCNTFGISQGIMKEGGVPVNSGIVSFVDRIYTKALGRYSERGGLVHWALKIDSREMSAVDVAKSFFASEEYGNHNYNNGDFVETLYLTFMGRASDADGKAHWVGILKGGMTREEVITMFASSQEFSNILQSYGLQ